MVNEVIPNQMPSNDKTQDSLKAAAKAWRLPYWDWAVNNEVPLLAQDKEIEVFTKFGIGKIRNAMYQYNLPEGKTFGTMGPTSNQTYVLTSADRFPWELPVATGRCSPSFSADANAFQAGTVDNDQVATNIRNTAWYDRDINDPTLRESVYRLLTYDVPYEVFATTNLYPGTAEPEGYLNCEYIHNNVHNWVGGDAGQMGDVPVAAYDPIFFLHHCVRDWMQLGYSYPELQPWKYETTEDYLLSLNTDIARLYRVTADHISDVWGRRAGTHIVHSDYVVNVRYGKYDLGGLPYIVRLYLRRKGSHDEDESAARLPRASSIGSVYNFSTATGPQGTNTRCANCAAQQAKGTLSTAQIPITSFLLKIAGEYSWPGDTMVPGARV
ncbi:hypothetical protein SLS62_004091 [Diatrype stigma]|uniref:tyrosinase n=1 Tax=Diatrype stigma TaxID=117547 RepID=A0AAN9YTH8_9PEZI